MRIDLRNPHRRRLFQVEIDPRHPPPVVRDPRPGQGEDPQAARAEVFLDWEQTLDDQGHLRRCPACGCRELFVRRNFPRVTAFAAVVLASVAAMLLAGMHQLWPALAVLAAVVLIDLAVWLLSGRHVVCYRCHSAYFAVPPARDQGAWDAAVAQRYETGDG